MIIDLKRFRKDHRIKQIDVANKLDVDQSRISKYESGADHSPTITELLLKNYTELEKYIIQEIQTPITLNENVITYRSGENNIIHIPQAAEAGFIGGFSDITRNEETESWHLPGFKGKGYSFVVSGDSMLDTFRSGEIVVTSQEPVRSINEIINDFVYVIETNENILIKRVVKHSDYDKLWILSDNEDFKDVELSFSEIRRMFKARRHITFNLSHKMRYE